MYGLKRSKKDESGMIHGAGTGTSDDIQKNVPAGSYIMPADSTQNIGAEILKELGEPKAEEAKETIGAEKAEMAKKNKKSSNGVPVNVSHGEYELPPEQVHAVGVQALNQMKDSTHTNVPDQQGFGLKQGARYASQQSNDLPLGLNPEALANYQNSSNVKIGKSGKPELFFVNGGVVNSKPQKSLNDLVLNNNDDLNNSFTADVWRSAGTDATNSINQGNYARGVGQMVRGAIGIIPAAAYDVGKTAYNKVGRPVASAIDGFLGTGEDQSPSPSPATQQKPKPKVPTTNNNTGVTDNPFGDAAQQAAAKQAAAQQAAAKTPANNIFNLAQDQSTQQKTQSDPYAIQQKGNSFSYSNPAAAANAHANGIPELATSGFANVKPINDPRGVANMFANTREMGPNDQQIQNAIAQREASVGNGGGFGARVYSLGNSGQAADTLQKRIDDVSQPIPGSKGLTASQRNQIVELQNGYDNRANDVYKTDANNAAALQREAMGQAGSNYRTGLQEDGKNNRYFAGLAQDSQKFNADYGLKNRQMNLTETKEGFGIRNAARIESLQNQYDAAKTDEERQSIMQRIQRYSGSGDSFVSGKDRYITVGGGQQWDEKAGTMVNRPQQLFDIKTQQFVNTSAQIPIHQNPAAQAIVNNKSLDEASKRKALADLGYQNN